MLKGDFSKDARNSLAAIFSLSGTKLSDAEKLFFREVDPFGFILFARNCQNPRQLHALVQSLKETVGRDCPVLIDQEGGRVQRLRKTYWREFKSFKYFGDLFEKDKEKAIEELRFETLRISESLTELGINVNCSPVLDLFFQDCHEIIGDRAFSHDPDIVARLGLCVCRHFLDSGITPVIKHIPGHGRSMSDSHLDLPVILTPKDKLEGTDFKPFREISSSEVGKSIWAMSAHIIYKDIDPDFPATLSKKLINDVIRKDIGFDGILIGDDLDMKALDPYGTVTNRALSCLDAGCDLSLYCAGELPVMEDLAKNLPRLSHQSISRLQAASQYNGGRAIA